MLTSAMGMPYHLRVGVSLREVVCLPSSTTSIHSTSGDCREHEP